MTSHPSGWTTEKPTVEGWYWYRTCDDDQVVTYVHKNDKGAWIARSVEWDMGWYLLEDVEVGGSWLGPLTPEQYIEWAQAKGARG